MALTEQRVLNQVTVLPNEATVNVQWMDQILRDGQVVASTPHRKAYTADQKDAFLVEVDGAGNYINALGWL